MPNMFRDTTFHAFNFLDSLTVIANSDKTAKICRLITIFICPQDIDVASIEPIQSFLSLYMYYIVIYIKASEALY